MKKISLLIVLLCGAMMVSAQTYKDGVWYALYDEEGFVIGTVGSQEIAVFAPTAGSFTFTSTYNKWLANVFPKCKTYVFESANNGSSSTQIGQALPDVDLSFSYGHFGESHNNSLSCSRNINWIKFDRAAGNTHDHKIENLKIRLAQHILLASGEYGTNASSLSFEERDMLTVSEPQRVNLRSFLTNSDIHITCSQPDIFRIGSADNTNGLTYAVGANACASANLGTIDAYAFDVYFTPQEGKAYEAQITITDGLSTATVTVSGTGLYVAPPTPPEDTYFAYGAAICEGDTYSDERFHDLSLAGDYTDTIPNIAGADSIITFTLTVNPLYHFEDSLELFVGDSVTWQAIDLSVLPIGDTILVASYAAQTTCDSTYTLYLTVRPRITTYGNDTIELCHGEQAEYEGKLYRRATVDSVRVSQVNQFGGDSIVELVVIVYPQILITVTQTIREGEEQEWEGYDLSQYPIGDTTLVAQYSSIHGCDSTFVLNLSVLLNTEGIDLPGVGQEKTADKVIINGRLYIRKGEDYFDALGRKL